MERFDLEIVSDPKQLSGDRIEMVRREDGTWVRYDDLLKDKAFADVENQLRQWKWKCAELAAALAKCELAISECKTSDAKAKADGTRTI